MNSNNQNPELENMQLPEGVEYVYDTKRVFVLYSNDPDGDATKKRARSLKRSWEKVFGKDTCEVAVVKADERVETLA